MRGVSEMINKHSEGSIDLQRFADGAGGGADGAGDAGVSAASAQPQTDVKVLYGRQPAAEESAVGTEENAKGENPDVQTAENDGEENAGENGAESFDDLIGGKFRNEFNERVNGIVQRRLAEKNGAHARESAIVSRLCARYGAKDIGELEAFLGSEEAVSSLAVAAGMNTDTYLELERLREETAAAHEMQQRLMQTQAAEKQYADWTREAESVRGVYEDFNLDEELKNPQFRSLIMTKNPQYSISMLDAYRIAHFDEISKAAEAQAAEKVAASVSARAARPAENGLGSGSGVVVKSDVKAFTKKDRQEIARRVARGEKIVL